MIIKKSEFMITAVNPSQYPGTGWPEVAFVGRSNVGKSSLINTLLNRKNLARVGNTPGKTRVINFYNVNDQLIFVDLPGYGYAKVSKEEKESWGSLVETYLNTRDTLSMVLLLVDIRHEPTRDDLMMYDYIRASNRRSVVIATKADKITRAQYQKQTHMIRTSLNLDSEMAVIPFSSMKRIGIDEVWSNIETILE